MKAMKKEMILRKNQVSFGAIDHAAKKASQKADSGALRDPELLAFMADAGASRVSRIAKIASLSDIDLLIAVAVGSGPTFVRRNAIQRIDELCIDEPLREQDIRRLVPCLNEKDLFASTVALMDAADFDWCAQCTESTVDVLCAAMYETTSMYETVLLEDAFAHLAHSRRDLNKSLCACSPEKFLMKNTYAPISMPPVMAFDPTKKNNVA